MIELHPNRIVNSKGKQKIIFEITDGASSCPGSAKEAVQELLSKNVEIYAFQMGKATIQMKRSLISYGMKATKSPME